MSTIQVNLNARCPACQKTLDAVTDPEKTREVGPGDLSVCVYCSLLLTFNTDMTVRALRPEEYYALPNDTRWKLRVFQDACRCVMTGDQK